MTTGPAEGDGEQELKSRHGGQSGPARPPIVVPGSLRGGAWLTLQTRHAGRLVKGRPGTAGKPPIIGLLGFADRLRLIWQGIRASDPYAEWWMVKVDRALALAEAELQALRRDIDTRSAASDGLEIDPAVSVQPTRVKLEFANPYAYRGAQLLASYDGFARQVLSARHVGLAGQEEAERYLREGARPLRRAFGSALGYRFLGVTRADTEQQTVRGKQAVEAMGELPPEILSDALRASLLPKRVATANETAAPLSPDTSAPSQ
jgi:integrating conjugative element protein (TIGR03761 family)